MEEFIFDDDVDEDLERLAVDGHLAGALGQEDAGDGGLAPAGALVGALAGQEDRRAFLALLLRGRGRGRVVHVLAVSVVPGVRSQESGVSQKAVCPPFWLTPDS